RGICAESNCYGDRSRPNGEWKRQRIKCAVEGVGALNITARSLKAFIFLQQHTPAHRCNHQPSSDLHYGKRDAEEVKHVSPNEIRASHQHQTVQCNPPCKRSARGGWILLGHGQENGTSSEGINDGKQRAYGKQEYFDRVGHLFLLNSRLLMTLSREDQARNYDWASANGNDT